MFGVRRWLCAFSNLFRSNKKKDFDVSDFRDKQSKRWDFEKPKTETIVMYPGEVSIRVGKMSLEAGVGEDYSRLHGSKLVIDGKQISFFELSLTVCNEHPYILKISRYV